MNTDVVHVRQYCGESVRKLLLLLYIKIVHEVQT